jgi:hypothetical protein
MTGLSFVRSPFATTVLPVTDADIRQSIHRQLLRRHHAAADTLIVDELGLKHGHCRADIAVVNGRLIGYEIKSSKDSLCRLKHQIAGYNAVFDSITIVVGSKHGAAILRRVPRHWGILIAMPGIRGAMRFKVRRKAKRNNRVHPYSVAQLLWKNEAVALLNTIGITKRIVGLPRTKLCKLLVSRMSASALKRSVRESLRQRSGWPNQQPSFQCGDSFRPSAKLSNLLV